MNDPQQIQAALVGLHQRYPHDTVSAWWEIAPNGTDGVVFRVHDETDWNSGSIFGHGCTLEAALSDLIKRAGERTPEKLRQQKIAALRDQLAKLEAVQPVEASV